MTEKIQIYARDGTRERLRQKAAAQKLFGKGAIARYIEKCAWEDIAFLGEDVRAILNLLNVTAKPKLK